MCPIPASSPARASRCPFSSLFEPQSNDVAPLTCPWQHSSTQLQPAGCTESDVQQQQQEASPCASEDSGNSISISSSTSSSSSSYVHQAWQLKRPVLSHDPKLTRRQLRKLNRTWSLSDVAQHKFCDDGWVAVDGKVYDITEHITSHPGWDSGCRVTEVLSIIAHLGCDCSAEFHEIHRAYPVSYKQLAAYYIGDLLQ